MAGPLKSEIATRHLQGYSELSLRAPIKDGFVPSLDSRTYVSRVKAVLDSLHLLRTTSREYSLIRPFSDSTDRIRTINSLRIWVDDAERFVVLSVGFDRPWEAYLRTIWRDVGTLLDLIFCNCEGYPISAECTFAEYGKWISDARTDTRFFYNNSNLTVDDLQYLSQAERLQRGNVAGDLACAEMVAEDPERMAIRTALAAWPETLTQGMQALSVLYRLADLYPPDLLPDGDILLRAAQQLLRELRLLRQPDNWKRLVPEIAEGAALRFRKPLTWFECQPKPHDRTTGEVSYEPTQVQAGIVKGHAKRLTHGAALLITVHDAAAGARFIERLSEWTGHEDGSPPIAGLHVNVAFTHAGLKKLGMSDADLAVFPVEFREGMEARAGLLGDVRSNHPGRWTLPERNWPGKIKVGGETMRVPLAAVHIVVQLFMDHTGVPGDHELVEAHPLRGRIEALMAGFDASREVQLVSVQVMRRRYLDGDGQADRSREHFGFIDGTSQPEIGTPPVDKGKWSNIVRRGDILLGYANTHGDAPQEHPLLHNGSFLVVRKLRQDVKALNDLAVPGLSIDELKSKMMGREIKTGASPIGGVLDNAFDYDKDPTGKLCPFQSHVRRINPRAAPWVKDLAAPDSPTRRDVPRIMRRGMSYGPAFGDSESTDRGLLFMAYNAQIGEQFETLQRWISGGNGSGVYSGQADPFLGVPQRGDPRTFRFHDGDAVVRVALDDPAAPMPTPFVQLEWGAYLFTPSLPALGQIARIAAGTRADTGLVAEGAGIVACLLAREKLLDDEAAIALWKEVLEDNIARRTRRAQAVWAAIRECHGGALRTRYGVLVASKELVMQVFDDPHSRYSVKGYRECMRQSFGEIYLGLDEGPRYTAESTLANAAILDIRMAAAFDSARKIAGDKLREMMAESVKAATALDFKRWELTFDVKELSDHVLAEVNKEWFGLPDGKFIQSGGWNWEMDKPSCPGHFTAPSRYIFQPHPGPEATRHGRQQGQAVKAKMLEFVTACREGTAEVKGTISKDLFAALNKPEDDDLLARTLIGIMMGYLPTVEANLKATLNEWLEDGTLWELQSALIVETEPAHVPSFDQVQKVLLPALMRTMQLRPLPELTWRIAKSAHRLGNVAVVEDDLIVIGMVSAVQQDLAAVPSPLDVYPVFGGDRRSATSHTHACPGYEAGLGVLLGIFTALFEAGPLLATPAPLTLRLRGST